MPGTADAPAELSVRAVEESDIDGLVRLLQRCFPGWPGGHRDPAAHLRWKLSGDLSLAAGRVVEDGDRLIAAALFWVACVRVAGREFTALTGIDQCVDPEYRGRGLFARIAGGSEPFDLNFSQTANPTAMRVWMQALGGRRFANRPRLVARPLLPGGEDGRTALRSRAERLVGGLRLRPGRADADVTSLSSFDERVDALYEEAARPFGFIAERTARRLNWRYGDPRGGAFALRAVEGERARLDGYAVLTRRGSRGYIADLLVRPGRPDALRLLLADAVAWSREAGLRSLRTWTTSGHPYGGELRAAGFAGTGRAVRLVYNRIAAPAEHLALLDDPRTVVHITPGDMDVV
jgi:hypothetical protein